MNYYSRPRISKICNEQDLYNFSEAVEDLLLYTAQIPISIIGSRRMVQFHLITKRKRNFLRYFVNCADNGWIPNIAEYAYHKQGCIDKISDIRRREIM